MSWISLLLVDITQHGRLGLAYRFSGHR